MCSYMMRHIQGDPFNCDSSCNSFPNKLLCYCREKTFLYGFIYMCRCITYDVSVTIFFHHIVSFRFLFICLQ